MLMFRKKLINSNRDPCGLSRTEGKRLFKMLLRLFVSSAASPDTLSLSAGSAPVILASLPATYEGKQAL